MLVFFSIRFANVVLWQALIKHYSKFICVPSYACKKGYGGMQGRYLIEMLKIYTVEMLLFRCQ